MRTLELFSGIVITTTQLGQFFENKVTKRLLSTNWKEIPSMLSKLGKAKKSFFSKFSHLNKEEKKQQVPQEDARSSTPFPALVESSFQDSQNPITARQLEAYYTSLKLQNEALAENLTKLNGHTNGQNNTNKSDDNLADKKEKVSNSWNNAESTNIEQSGSMANAKPGAADSENAVILFEESPESDIELEDYPESLGLPVMLSQPDPLERANLVQLKKMMELEKYRRYRLSYLREHTRHVNRSGIQKVTKNIIKQKYKKMGKALEVTAVPKERQNKSGMFGISLLDTVDDNAIESTEEEPQIVKPIDDDVVKKLKFPNTTSAGAKFTMPSKPKSFNAEELKDGKSSKMDESTKDKKPSASVTAIKPLFGSTSTEKDIEKQSGSSFDEQPSAAFKFNPPSVSKETASESAPTSTFGTKFAPMSGTKSESEQASNFPKPVSVPAPNTSSVSFGKLTTPGEAGKTSNSPAFNFGDTPDFSKKGNTKRALIEYVPDDEGLNDSSMNIAKRKAPNGFGSQDHTGTSKGKSSIGVFNVPSTTTTSTASLFGKKDSSVTDSTSSNLQDAQTDTKSAQASFQFGNSTAANSLKVPSLNFSTPKTEAKDNSSAAGDTGITEKPLFSFGGFSSKPVQDEKDEKKEIPSAAKAVFSFGNAAQKSNNDFSFGSVKNSETPSFKFGVSTSDKLADKPADVKATKTIGEPAALSDTSSQNKTEGEVKPLSENFASKGFANISTGSNALASSNGFSFGSSTAFPIKEGATKEAGKKEGSQQAPTLNFGGAFKPAGSSATEKSNPEDSKPKFNFGANANVSSFSSTLPLGNGPDKKSVNGSAFGETTNTNNAGGPKFNFGNSATSTDLVSVVKGTQQQSAPSSSNGSGFNFNAGTSTPNTTATFSGFNNGGTASQSNKKIEEVKSILGPPSTGFSFGSNANPSSVIGDGKAGTKMAFPASNSDNAASKSAFGSMGDAGSSGFNFGTSGGTSAFGNSQLSNNASNNASNGATGGTTYQPPTAGKIFSINNNAFPSLNQVPKPAISGFGGSAQKPSFNFGGASAPAPAPAATNVVGFPSAPSAFGGMMNNGQGMGGMVNNGNIFGGNVSNPGFPTTGTNSGGNSSVGNSRSGTPSFNFTGQSANVDPSSIFQSSQNGTPPPGQPNIMARRRAYPRGMRGRRQQ